MSASTCAGNVPGARAGALPRVGVVIRLGIVLGVLIAVAAGLLINDLYHRSIKATQKNLMSLSLVLADQADRALQSIDIVQQGVINDINSAKISSEEEFVAYASTRSVHDTLVNRVTGLPQTNAVTLIDQNGKLLNFSRFWPIPNVSVSDRDYFTTLKENPALDRFLSQPVSNRGDRIWTLYMARRIATPDGQFLGLVLGAVDLAYFEHLYAQVSPSSDYVFSQFRSDGMLLLRHPSWPSSIGKVFQTTAAKVIADRGASSGVLRGRSPIDGMNRVTSTRMLDHFPIRFSISRTSSASLAAWRMQAVMLAMAALLIEAGLVSVLWLSVRQSQNLARLSQAEIDRSAAEDRARSESALREHYARFGLAMETMAQGLCMIDDAGRLIICNGQLAMLFGLGDVAQPGTSCARLLSSARASRLISPSDACQTIATWRRMMAARLPVQSTLPLTDGRTLLLKLQPTAGGGCIVTCDDITEQRRAQADIAFLAHHDQLTGLPNRALFTERLVTALQLVELGTPCGVMCLDLVRFKEINDTFGHGIGDLLLQEMADRLRRAIRSTDTVARIGGDEFAVIFAAPGSRETLANRATSLIEDMGRPCELDGRVLSVSISAGVALAPDDASDAATLLKHADIALHSAKIDGYRQARLFAPDMNQALLVRRQTEADLMLSLSRDEFELHYQPLVRLECRSVVGFEALLRWRHPTRGLVSPTEFIPLAEETGLIVPIGVWALRVACAEAATWPGRQKVAVNLSPIQVRDRRLVLAVAAALADTGLPAAQLELEITETVLMRDAAETLETLAQLHKLGVSIALDDFGTGFSSLSYLRSFPFDKVKIDRCFVQDLGTGHDVRAIVHAIVGLCIELGITTLAEGVEREEQVTILEAERCKDVQGFFFSCPVPAADIPAVLERFTPRRELVAERAG
ncbi:MAG: bifunctional diguanylate cyclase/phosphodiesterase [Janthinobacterium lividum]